MKVRRFSLSTTLALPRERVFPFFAAAANLEHITPPELKFRIVTPLPIEMREGALIRYRLSLHGIPFEWLTRITVWNPPHEFLDEQVKGPYKQWIHRHTFTERGDSTAMEDVVEYALPFYPFGEIAAPIVAAQIRRIFDYRTAAIERLLLTADGRSGSTDALPHP